MMQGPRGRRCRRLRSRPEWMCQWLSLTDEQLQTVIIAPTACRLRSAVLFLGTYRRWVGSRAHRRAEAITASARGEIQSASRLAITAFEDVPLCPLLALSRHSNHIVRCP